MKHMLLFFLCYTNLFSQWLKTNTTEDGPDLYSVYFIDDNNGWIAGASGTILKLDQQLLWEKQNSGTSKTLMSIGFFNNDIGLAVGDSGIIIKSTDGGNSWMEIQHDDSYKLNYLFIVNDSLAYASGTVGKILKTTNRGKSWINLDTKVNNNFNAIYFVNENVGYLGSDSFKVIKTYDGGASWSPINLNEEGNIKSLYFLDSLTGYAGTDDEFQVGRLMYTSNGGRTWTEKDNSSGGIHSMCFNDVNNGLFVCGSDTWYRKICTLDNDTVNIKYYHQEEYDLFSCKVTPSGKGWAVGGGGAIFYADNYKGEWQQLFYGNSEINYSIADLNDEIFITGSRNNFLEPYGKIFKLNLSKGNFWEQTIIPNSSNSDYYSFYSISSLDSNHYYAGGSGGWYFSSDRGKNWLKNDNIVDVHKILFVDELIGYLYNENGIFKTSDGGVNWIQLDFTFPISEIHFVNKNLGFISSASDSGWQIHKTTNGGNEWTLTSETDYPKLTSIYFVDDKLGFAVGWLNTILKTSDSGTTWSSYNLNKNISLVEYKSQYFENVRKITLSPFNYIKKIKNSLSGYVITPQDGNDNCSFITFKNNIGYITQNGGKILRTYDYGEHWEIINSGIEDDLLSIAIMQNGYSALLTSKNAYLNKNFGTAPQVNNENPENPKSFILFQNYPNPFNPTTTIKFEMPFQQKVKIIIYNLVGEVVEEIFNSIADEGINEVQFDGSKYSSGMYIYKIVTNNYSTSKKMILLK